MAGNLASEVFYLLEAVSSYALRLIKYMHNLESFTTTTLRATDGILVDDVENLLVNIVAVAKFGN